jgi:hypothetical protein
MFDIRDPSNTLQGQVLRSGICVQEDGEVKPIQQLNMCV